MECRVTPDFTLPANLTNPNRHYGYLRECDPVHWNPSIGGWMLTRYDDVQAAENDPEDSLRYASKNCLKAMYPKRCGHDSNLLSDLHPFGCLPAMPHNIDREKHYSAKRLHPNPLLIWNLSSC